MGVAVKLRREKFSFECVAQFGGDILFCPDISVGHFKKLFRATQRNRVYIVSCTNAAKNPQKKCIPAHTCIYIVV